MLMWLAVGLTVLIVSAWGFQIAAARRRSPALSEREAYERQQFQQWRADVLHRLGPAVRRLELARTPGVSGVSGIEGLELDAPGSAIESGWAWRFRTPGVATIADLKAKEAKLRSALNVPTPLVQALAVSPDPRYEGLGTLRVYQKDPIHKVRTPSWRPGEKTMSAPTDNVLAGVTRWGQEIRLPLWRTHWAVAGQNESGKTSAVRVVIDQLVPFVLDGTVRLHFVDIGKRGRGYRVYRSLFTSWWVNEDEALNGVDGLLNDLRSRSEADGDRAVPISRANPMDVLIVEEGPEFLRAGKGKRTGATLLLSFAQQTRELGGVLVFVSQTLHHTVVPTTLRGQLRLRAGFRVATADESRQIIDGASETADGPHTIPKTDGRNGTVDWRGVSYVDPDGTGTELVRWFYISEQRAGAVGRLGAGVA